MCWFTDSTKTMQDKFEHIVGTGPFGSYADFQSKLKEYERATGTCYYIRSTYSIERRTKFTGTKIPEVMGYYWVRYICVHNGRPIRPKGRKRRVQNFSCPSELCLVYDEEFNGLRITRKNLKHNHPTVPSFPEAYSKNRRLTTEQEEVMFTLLDSFHSIAHLKNYAETLYQIRLTSDDMRRLRDRHRKRHLPDCDSETVELNSQSPPTPSPTLPSTNVGEAPSSESRDSDVDFQSERPLIAGCAKEDCARELTTRLYDALIKLNGQDFEKMYTCLESVLHQGAVCNLPLAEPAIPPAATFKKPRSIRTRFPSTQQVLQPAENVKRFRPILPKVVRGGSAVLTSIALPKTHWKYQRRRALPIASQFGNNDETPPSFVVDLDGSKNGL